MMDAVEFVKAMDRMCESHETCGECGFAFGKAEGCGSYIFDHPDKAVRIVEEWRKAHLIQTNADKFKEVFGDVESLSKHGELPLYECRIMLPRLWWSAPYEASKGE